MLHSPHHVKYIYIYIYIYIYRTLHCYKSFWVVCHLFPQRWRTLNIQSRETIGQDDHVTCLKLRPRVNSSPAFLSHLQDAYFQTPLSSLTKFLRNSNTLPLAWIQERKATPCIGLADIHIQWLWDAFQSLRNCPFITIKKGHFKLVILFIA